MVHISGQSPSSTSKTFLLCKWGKGVFIPRFNFASTGIASLRNDSIKNAFATNYHNCSTWGKINVPILWFISYCFSVFFCCFNRNTFKSKYIFMPSPLCTTLICHYFVLKLVFWGVNLWVMAVNSFCVNRFFVGKKWYWLPLHRE